MINGRCKKRWPRGNLRGEKARLNGQLQCRKPSERRKRRKDNQSRALGLGGIGQGLYSALLKSPTCNLEGDGEERGDTRLLLSLGLIRCNYRGNSY